MHASDIMTRKVFTIEPEAGVRDLARLLSRKRISGAPVVGAEGTILGIVTEADILGNVDRDGLRVVDIMSRQIISVQEDTPVREIACILAERKIKRVPVVRGGSVVGIVSRADIVDAISQGHIVVRDW